MFAKQTDPASDKLATIEGHVVHGITREPVRKVRVGLELSEGSSQEIALVATTDEEGRFRFADVKAGRYSLTAGKKGFLDSAYWKTTPDDPETLLQVRNGDRLNNLDLRLFPGATITGRITDAEGDAIPDDIVVLWTKANQRQRFAAHMETATNHLGEYRFEGLVPGAYYVSANAFAGERSMGGRPVDSSGKLTKMRELTTFYPAALSLADAQSINIGGGQEQSGVDIRIQRGPMLSVSGRIDGISQSPLQHDLSARIEDGIGWASERAVIQPNGDFAFKELPPGKHRLNLLEHGKNGIEVTGKTEINLTDHDVTGVVINLFKPAQVRVRVAIEGEETKPLTTGSVFPHPATDEFSELADRQMQYQSQNGTYVIDGVSPNRYWAWFNGASGCYLKWIRLGEQTVAPQAFDVKEGAVLDVLLVFSRNGASVTGDVDVGEEGPKHSPTLVLISEEQELPSQLRYSWIALDQSLHFSSSRLRPGKYLASATVDRDLNAWTIPEFVTLLNPAAQEIELQEKSRSSLHLKLIPSEETDRIRHQLGIEP